MQTRNCSPSRCTFTRFRERFLSLSLRKKACTYIHNPQYPLFVMVNFVATKLLAFVGGSPAFRSNVVNSAFDTLCAILSFLTVETWTSQTDAYDTFAAMGSAVMYAVSPLIWTYAISSEVFAMNNFLHLC